MTVLGLLHVEGRHQTIDSIGYAIIWSSGPGGLGCQASVRILDGLAIWVRCCLDVMP